MGFVDELKWRGMIQDIMPGTEDLLNKEMVSGYIGFDPTADSLGIGNLVQIMTLLHFQRAGHKPIALIGGATGMVGDPSGRSEERNMLDEKILNHNLACQKKQLEKFLDFSSGKNAAEIVNNFDWFKELSFLDFIRDIGKYITVNYMLAKDSVKNRIAGEGREGMSFTEFSYQLVQGYDFFWLWKNKNVKLQLGGSDQWGNIVTGTELIKRKGRGEAFALTTPLIKKADGSKFGKSANGNVWLDSKRTSPYAFYQFWLNASDDDVKIYIRIFSLKGREEIEQLEADHEKDKGKRLLQKELAREITIRVHSEKDLEKAIEISEIFFNGTIDELKKMSLQDISSVHQSLDKNAFTISKAELSGGINILELLSAKTTVFPSKGEARKMLQGGGVFMNKEKITDLNFSVDDTQLLNNTFLLVQKGKKNFYLLKAE